MTKKRIGKCALCGNVGKLTFEHIPPKAAFNSNPVKPICGMTLISKGDRLPWDTAGLQYKNMQQGMGLHSLCASCNSKTGKWYGDAYRNFAALGAKLLEIDTNQYQGVEFENLYPLRIIKQVLSMFCSINPYHNLKIDDLRQFVLNRDDTHLDLDKYRICMYFTRSRMMKYCPSTVVVKSDDKFATIFSSEMVSEITAFPFGFILYLDPIHGQHYEGIDISACTDKGYNEICNVRFPIVLHDVNTWLPTDFRSKAEVIKCIDKNKTRSDLT